MAKARKRILIINADDLGYTRGINEAIGQCCAAGTLRSSTLMANGEAFDHAVAIAGANENLDVGVHLVLTELPPVASVSKVCGLVDEHGQLPGNPWRLAASLSRGTISKEAIREELRSQITKVLDHGLKPTHLDSHKHVHALPQVLEIVLQLARKFAIPWLRNPFDETPFFPVARLVDRRRTGLFLTQHLKAKLFGAFRPSFLGRMKGTNMRTSQHFLGMSLTGIWNKASMNQLLRELPPGITEWMLHPGNCDSDLRRLDTRLLEQREKERDLLLSPELHEHLASHDITLSSFRAEIP